MAANFHYASIAGIVRICSENQTSSPSPKVHIGLVLLTHQLGYFNILPLNVALLFIDPKIFE